MNNSTDLLGFNLLYKLGQGAFSTSYLAEQSGKMVAIKVIEIPNPTTSRDMTHDMLLSKEFQSSLRQTCSNLNELLKCMVKIDDQKGILKYHDYKITLDKNTGVYKLSILVEYLDSFNTYVRKNNLTVRKVLKMFMDLCDGLQAMHNMGFCHGNIKETNIFYDNIKGFKLGDFFFNDLLINTLKPRESYANYGCRFLAPEAYDIGQYSYKTDMFTLAMLVYKILNNSLLPFEYEGEITSQKEIREKFLANRTLPPSSLIPSSIYDILRRATSNNPNDRYESYLTIKDDIKNAIKTINFDELERIVDYKISEELNDMLPSPMQQLQKEPTSVSYEISVQDGVTEVKTEDIDYNKDDDKPNMSDTPAKQEEAYIPGPNEMKILEENGNEEENTVLLGIPKKNISTKKTISNEKKKNSIDPPKDNNEEKIDKKTEKNKNAPLYSYYDEEDEESDYGTQNWISTLMVVLGLAILCIALYFLLPILENFFKK